VDQANPRWRQTRHDPIRARRAAAVSGALLQARAHLRPNRVGSDALRVRRFNMHESAVNSRPMFLSRLLGLL
jgi:hypothetical protein